VRVAYVRGSVLLRHINDRPHRLLAGRGDGSAQHGCNLYDWLVCPVASGTWSASGPSDDRGHGACMCLTELQGGAVVQR